MSKRIPSEGPIQQGSWSERVMVVYNTGNGVPPIELLRAQLPPSDATQKAGSKQDSL